MQLGPRITLIHLKEEQSRHNRDNQNEFKHCHLELIVPSVPLIGTCHAKHIQGEYRNQNYKHVELSIECQRSDKVMWNCCCGRKDLYTEQLTVDQSKEMH